MSRRWFVSSVAVGAALRAQGVKNGRPVAELNAQLTGTVGEARTDRPIDGPPLSLLGPGDVVGFERSLVVREEPPAGQLDGVAENFACVEFSDASLPWQFSHPTGDQNRQRPWLVLLVLREDEAKLTGTEGSQVLEAPGAALPDLTNSWAWAHVEARVADDAQGPEADVAADVRSGSQAVISRLLSPRRLEPDSAWVACVVPATEAGVAAGLDPEAELAMEDHYGVAWQPGQAQPARLPVYHSWRFRTGEKGSFEQLARLVEPVEASTLPGFGARTVEVRHPWPGEEPDPLEGAPASVTTSIQGALRVPEAEVPEEVWSHTGAQARFVEKLSERLNAPARRFDAIEAEPERDEKAVAPPLYGSHFAGIQKVPPSGWMSRLNLEVRHRVAAALGCRYVQAEQEFLMARAWEQLGAINEANRLLAAAELSAEAAAVAQDKHLKTMDPTQVTLLAAPMRTEVEIEGIGSLEQTLVASALPDGAASAAFRRLTRAGGGLERRTQRQRAAIGGGMPATSVVAEGLQGLTMLPDSVASVTAEEAPSGVELGVDTASFSAWRSLVPLLEEEQPALAELGDESMGGISSMVSAAAEGSLGPAMARSAPAPRLLRALRRRAYGDLVELPAVVPAFELQIEDVAESVRSQLLPLGQQLNRIAAMVDLPPSEQRAEAEPRPLRSIMAHPRFGMPIAAELLSHWPDWAVPGISGFPANRATLLETNSQFVESVMVGLNQEFNRELLWREFSTDQRGSAFTRFWPSEVDEPDVDEIARWAPESALGEHDGTGGRDLIVLLVRADVLRRFPGTVVLAARSLGDGSVPGDDGDWKKPTFLLAVDEQTSIFAFDLTEKQVRAEGWMFVMREPLHGTQFGIDDEVEIAPGPDRLPVAEGDDGAEVARRVFQQQFQLAFSPTAMLGEPQQ